LVEAPRGDRRRRDGRRRQRRGPLRAEPGPQAQPARGGPRPAGGDPVSRGLWVGLGTALGVAGVGGALLYSRRASAAGVPPSGSGQAPTPGPLPPIDLAPLPKASDVRGDLVTNWGET